MDTIEYQLYGDSYYEKIKIENENIVIYDGYVDDLVTISISGELELNLNFQNTSNISSVIGKLVSQLIIWIPKSPECFFNSQYVYYPIMFSQEKFCELYDAMRYDGNSDLEYINEASLEEIILMWLISSGYRSYISNIKDYAKFIKSKILFISEDDNLLNNLINMVLNSYFEKLNVENIIIEATDEMEKIVFYLDEKSNYEWEALKIDANKNIYLHLGNDKCIRIFKK